MKTLILLSLLINLVCINSSGPNSHNDLIPTPPQKQGKSITIGDPFFRFAVFIWRTDKKNPESATKWFTGTLINKDWVLTSGHHMPLNEKYRVSLGAKSLGRKVHHVNVTDIRASKPIKIAGHKHGRAVPDLLMLKLAHPVPRDGAIHYANLSFDNVPDESFVDTGGWGKTSMSDERPSSEFKKARLRIQDLRCESTNQANLELEMCAIDAQNMVTPCTGDEGAPLMYGRDHKVVGVLSEVPPGCDEYLLTRFTRLRPYKSWIQSVIDGTGTLPPVPTRPHLPPKNRTEPTRPPFPGSSPPKPTMMSSMRSSMMPKTTTTPPSSSECFDCTSTTRKKIPGLPSEGDKPSRSRALEDDDSNDVFFRSNQDPDCISCPSTPK